MNVVIGHPCFILSCQHGLKQMGGCSILLFSDVDWRAYANKNGTNFVPNDAFTIRYKLTNYLVARCQKHCWSVSRVFSHHVCPQNIFVELKIISISSELNVFQNKAKNAVREYGKDWKMQDIPHDCGMVDTYGPYLSLTTCFHTGVVGSFALTANTTPSGTMTFNSRSSRSLSSPSDDLWKVAIGSSSSADKMRHWHKINTCCW